MKKSILLFLSILAIGVAQAQNSKVVVKEDVIMKKFPFSVENGVVTDTIFDEVVGTLRAYKKGAHASYYADKFNGKKTSSGIKFDNNDYTAAHKKLPFGTKLRVTNEANGKSVIVEVIDRGPFVKSREIDLTKRAFMDIANNKGAGYMKVTIEELVKQ